MSLRPRSLARRSLAAPTLVATALALAACGGAAPPAPPPAGAIPAYPGPFARAPAAITMSPIVPDHVRYPATGRDPAQTFGEVGLAGHWMKRLLHTMFIYKAKALPGWWLIPE